MSQAALVLPITKPRVDFRRLLQQINGERRMAGACTPALCDIYNQASHDEQRIIDAVLVVEQVVLQRLVRPEDIDLVRARRSQMDKATGDALARKEGALDQCNAPSAADD